MYPVDAEEVLKIRLTERRDEDFIAWQYEKNGIFLVKCAYRLALEGEQANKRQEGSSSSADGSRSLYNEIWMAQVPPKVHIFAWKPTLEGLATQCNRKKCTLIDDAMCHICGRGEESGFHAVVQCTKARALHHEL
jgi:5-methylcytosine-specific restriction endonuclease McrA